MSIRKGAFGALNKEVEGGADLHCPNLTLWFRAALAAQIQADYGAKKWVFTSWERCRPTQGCEDPSWDLVLKSFHLKCLVLSGKS